MPATNKEWRYVLQPLENEYDRRLLLDIHKQNEKILAALEKLNAPAKRKPK